jgi:hypothetical protein
MLPRGARVATQRWSVAMRRAVSGSSLSLPEKTSLPGTPHSILDQAGLSGRPTPPPADPRTPFPSVAIKLLKQRWVEYIEVGNHTG